MIRKGHLRLLPKPIAKCGWPYPTPRLDGVEIQRVDGGRRWLLTYTRRGKHVDVFLTTEELEDLVERGSTLLQRNRDDV